MPQPVRGGALEPVILTDENGNRMVVNADGSVNSVTQSGQSSPTFVQWVSAQLDAFGRGRFAQPVTLFDHKQIFDNTEIAASAENSPLFFDNQEISGSGTSTLYSQDRASTTLSVSNLTAGVRERRSKMRFNYQPGKSKFGAFTCIAPEPQPGITVDYGTDDPENGIFFRVSPTGYSFVIRSNASGSPEERVATRDADWTDKFDGTGPSGLTIDLTKATIIAFDFEWLGVGDVRVGFFYDNAFQVAYIFKNASRNDVVYMSTPNLPVSCKITNDGTGAAASVEMICCTVIAEGGEEKLGVIRAVPPSVWATNVINANVVGTTYLLFGIRLKDSHKGLTLDPEITTALATTADDFIVSLHLNPSYATDLSASWVGLAESGVQYCLGPAGATGEALTANGYCFGHALVSTAQEAVNLTIDTAVRLGEFIDGTKDELWLCATPLGINLDIQGAFSWRELL